MATLFPDHADLYHTGIVVHDLEKAKAEMSTSSWSTARCERWCSDETLQAIN